jgi:hypothetical protein
MSQQASLMMRTVLLLFLLAMQPRLALADQPFQRVGMIESVYASQQTIVINDVTYILPTSVRIYLFDEQTHKADGSRKEHRLTTQVPLRQGMRIGFNVEGAGPGKRGSIVEVWILPPGSASRSTE